MRPRAQPEVHQIFTGGDWSVRNGFKVSVGFDAAGRGPGLVLKTRLEWDWGQRAP